MAAAIEHPSSHPMRRSSVKFPPGSPVGVTAPQLPVIHNETSPPVSPTQKYFQIQETTDVDRNRNKFGDKSRVIRRMSSTEWENPFNSNRKFVQISDDNDRFEAKIDLGCFPGFSIDEIDVDVYDYDILIHARKDSPANPNLALSEVNRQYRLPDDVDLETVKLRKNRQTHQVSVEAEKMHGYGKPVSYAIVDVTNHNSNIKYIQ